MLAPWSLAVIVASVATSASGSTTRLCGGADLSRGNVSLTLRILGAPADPHSPYVGVRARNEDGSYTLSVGYRPTERGLGKPQSVYVDVLVNFPIESDARPLRLEWREPGGAWSNLIMWSTPQRQFPREEARFSTSYRLGQGEPYPHGTDLLDNLARGARYEFRNLDQAGNVVSTGTAEFPPQQVMEAMYATARAEAAARLRPCSPGHFTAPPARYEPVQ